MNRVAGWIGTRLARFLSAPTHGHAIAPATDIGQLVACLQPADVVLVEGHSRFSIAIKYLTQSTWSHVALYVGLRRRLPDTPPEPCFIEADVVEGVRMVGLEAFRDYHLRICRAVGLSESERQRVIDFALSHRGARYDLRNVFDLLRYMIPTPPVPVHLRRRLIAFGAGDPTRAICSTLVAQAFQSVLYPILPMIGPNDSHAHDCDICVAEILRVRDHQLFVPRDFDVSPYFEVVKPSLVGNPGAIEAARDALRGPDGTGRRLWR
ncbi:YiiX/YebB-like N1pC/P60 family cysteine hydrolase [Acidiphilium sp.]|uniref:YiiX/YebB-like N1pC/P60 family cysteine hydrolase n=1 Tax=Acidiphilium sp. TaxID=527 RepID=UPI003D01C334